MASTESSPLPAPVPAAADVAHPRDREVQEPYPYGPFLLLLFGAAIRIALGLSRVAGLAEVAFPDLSFVLLFLSVIWFHHSPPGSEARRRARFAIWIFMSSIIVGVAWGLVGPPPFEAFMWGIVAASVGGGLYILVCY